VATWKGQKAGTLVMENAKKTGQEKFISGPTRDLSESNNFFQRAREEVSYPLRDCSKVWFYDA
jgi:hypothetical protein